MHEENGVPKIADSAKCLGVRLPPNPNPDIVPDANGNVSGPGGMSCAPLIQQLPRHRCPADWNGTVHQTTFKVWKIDADDLGPDLVVIRDSPTHITIGPARKMSLDEFRAALATTQSKWKLVTP